MLSIGEVCTRLDLSPRTVRYYEELGLLPGVRRRAGGRRVYGPDELERLAFIQRLKALGLSLAEIKELNAVHALGGSTRAMLDRLSQLLAARITEVDARLESLQKLRDDLGGYASHIDRRIGELGASGAGEAVAPNDEDDERPRAVAGVKR